MSYYIRLSNEYAKTDLELLKSLYNTSKKYNIYANKKMLYIYRSNAANSVYKKYEVYFGKENFMHLAGFVSKIMNAEEFFAQCVEGTIKLRDILFKESRKSSSAKLDALEKLLDYKNVKIYRMGEADIIRQKNDFEIGIGNQYGILGFSQRKLPPALPIPVTVMKRPISHYVTKTENVVAVLLKEKTEPYYSRVIGCVKKGILCSDLPEHITSRIDSKISYITIN